MEKTYNPALIQRTQRYMETHSISQNQFAAKVNLSSAALSSYLNQKYKGSVEAVERQLSEFFKLDTILFLQMSCDHKFTSFKLSRALSAVDKYSIAHCRRTINTVDSLLDSVDRRFGDR